MKKLYEGRAHDRIAMWRVMGAVDRFHRAGDVPKPLFPAVPPDDRRDLRIRLVDEEVNKELIPALRSGDMAKIADGCADSIYVIVGTALEYGIPLDVVWQQVCAANDAKVSGETGKLVKDPGGKVLKPSGWAEADIETVLKDHGYTPPA